MRLRPYGGSTPRYVVLIALVLALMPGGLPRASAQDGEFSAAPTAVVAQGVAALPAPEAVWSVSRTDAEPVADAVAATRPLGFSLATGGPLMVSDQVTGARSRLSRDEAMFNADGASQIVASLGRAATEHVTMTLLPEGGEPASSGDGLVFVGDAFPAPPGERDIDLLTAVLEADRSLIVSSSKAPALVYAPQGLRYGAEGAPLLDLEAGEAVEINGEATLFAPEGRRGSEPRPVRVYVALIGAAIPVAPPEPTAVAVAPTGTGRITVVVSQCPGASLALNGSGATVDRCEPDGEAARMPGIVVTLENVATKATLSMETSPTGITGMELPAGSYRVLSFDGVLASSQAVISECTTGQSGSPRPDMVREDLPLADENDIICMFLADGGALDDADPDTDQGIVLTVSACPPEFVDFPPAPQAGPQDYLDCDGDATSPEGEYLVGAEVTVSGDDGSVTSKIYDPASEVFLIYALAPGSYTVDVRFEGQALPFRSACSGTDENGSPLGTLGPILPDSAQALEAGWGISCDILTRNPAAQAPASPEAPLTIDVVACPDGTNLPTFVGGESVYDCGGTSYGPDLAITAIGDSGATAGGTTDPAGSLTLSVLPDGYRLEFPGVAEIAYGLCGGPGVGLAGRIDNFSAGDTAISCSVSILNAADSAAAQDTDTDGDLLTDAQEARLGTDPAVVDTDGDGSVDGEEVYVGTDPLVA